MSEAEMSFLAAIRANPADDTARLVYSDWLDERGDHAKAELLRRGCEWVQSWTRIGTPLQVADLEWWAAVRPVVRVVLHSFPAEQRSAIVKLTRINQMGDTLDLRGASEALQTLPRTIRNRVHVEEAVRIASEFIRNGCAVTIESAT
jgi:uncharacterized protein (TIGR02996 family)